MINFYYLFQYSASNNPAAPIPVPIHIDITPYYFPYLFNSYNNVPTYLAPVVPNGWPNAIAPPFGLTLFSSIPNAYIQYEH